MRKKVRAGVARRTAQAGTALSELVVLLPLLLVMLLVSVDFGRLVYSNQVIVDLTRETANLVSRGTTASDALAGAYLTTGALDVIDEGGIIVSQVRRRTSSDSTPWVVQQDRRGPLGNSLSKVGTLNGKAKIPNVNQLDPGITIVAVEVLYPFDPVFNLSSLGAAIYPKTLYDVAYF